MTATKHLASAVTEANRLDSELGALIEAVRNGQVVKLDELSHLRRVARFVLTHIAMAKLESQRETEYQAPSDYHGCMSASQDHPGPLGFSEPCDCRGGICEGVLVDGVTANHRRCKAKCEEKL